MKSPLGPIIANIFMTKWEQKVMPKLNTMSPWVRKMDHTFATIYPDYISLRHLRDLRHFYWCCRLFKDDLRLAKYTQ